MEQGFIECIQKMVEDYGKETLLETRRAKSMLSDLTKNQFPKETNLLKHLLDVDCANIINRADNIAETKTALVKRLDDEHYISPKGSAEMLDLLALVLRGDTGKTVIEQPPMPESWSTPTPSTPIPFTPTLSAAQPQSNFSKTNAPVSHGDGHTPRVLVVDDANFVAIQLSQILTSAGYEVVDRAHNGAEGVKKYMELFPTIDLVTMDIDMPVMDGITALEKILEFDNNACVIMVGALGKDDIIKKALLTGAKSYVKKPLDRVKVMERVHSVLFR